MKEFRIEKNDEQQRVDRFVLKATHLPSSLMQKYIRIKRIKRNGKKTAPSERLQAGDTVQMYINDEWFKSISPVSGAFKPLDSIYQDENILIVNKPKGLKSQPDYAGEDSLVSRALIYLKQQGEWDPEQETVFRPALCQRLDRNTSGLVMIAKNASSLRIINQKIKDREIEKYYLAKVSGHPAKEQDTLKNWITKDESKKKAILFSSKTPGAKEAILTYRIVDKKNAYCELEIQLHTGRFHQIRAQMAHAGWPLIGDVKYGGPPGEFSLCAHKIRFSFSSPAGPLDYLNGSVFKIP